MKVPFARADITKKEEQAVLGVLRSGWITSGSKMQELEKNLSSYVGSGFQTVATNSATSGLHLALEAVGVKPGDKVLVPTLTFTATAEVVRYMGATPVLVDVDPDTMNIDMDDAKRRITPKCKAIIPVHFGGLPCDMRSIWSFAVENGLFVIEDAAHALGSSYEGKKIGIGKSDAVVFSFYATKCMTTAEGGAVVSQNPKLLDRMRVMRLHGISRDVFDRYTSGKSGWEYDVVAPGFKYNMPDVLAAIGVEQLKRLDEMMKKRQHIAEYYWRTLGNVVNVQRPSPNSCCHLFVIDVKDRNTFIEEMYKKGIGCSVHFKPLHRMTYWKNLADGKYPGADRVFEGCVSLPIYSKMSEEDVLDVIDAVYECIGC